MIFENRNGMYLTYMSNGSAENHHLQQNIVEIKRFIMATTLTAFYQSLYSKNFYKEVATQHKGSGFKFIALHSLVTIIFFSVAIYISFPKGTDGEIDKLLSDVPVFTMKNNELSIDRPSPVYLWKDEKDKDSKKALIDTETDYSNLSAEELFDWMKSENIAFLVTKKMAVIDEEQKNKHTVVEYKEFKLEKDKAYVFGKNEIKEIGKKVITYAIPVLIIFAYLFYFVYRIIQMLIYSAIAVFINNLMKANLEYDALQRIASYAIWPAIVVSLTATALDFELKMFISIIIVINYIFFAIKSAKA